MHSHNPTQSTVRQPVSALLPACDGRGRQAATAASRRAYRPRNDTARTRAQTHTPQTHPHTHAHNTTTRHSRQSQQPVSPLLPACGGQGRPPPLHRCGCAHPFKSNARARVEGGGAGACPSSAMGDARWGRCLPSVFLARGKPPSSRVCEFPPCAHTFFACALPQKLMQVPAAARPPHCRPRPMSPPPLPLPRTPARA